MPTKKFLSLGEKILEIVFGDSELSALHIRILSFCFIIIALSVGWVSHEATAVEKGWFGLREMEKVYRVEGFSPSMLSGLIAIIAIAPLYVRRVLFFDKFSVYQILTFVLNVSLTATFIQIILGNRISIFSFASIDNATLLIIAVLLTWLGMRAVAGFAWVAVILIAISTIVKANIAMANSGYIFILSGFLGILLQSRINPGELVVSLREGFLEDGIEKLQIQESVRASANATKGALSHAIKTSAQISAGSV